MEVDLLLINGLIFDTFTQSFKAEEVAIQDGKFIWRGINHAEFEIAAKEVFDLQGQHIVPGLVDVHMHIESSMTTPGRFSDAVLPHGTTTIVADAHEIANVGGLSALEEFMNQETVLDIFHAIPSSVPSTSPKLETTGGVIGLEEVAALLKHPKVIALGEVMNFKELVQDEPSLIKEIIKMVQAHDFRMPIEGHVPRISGLDLAKFIASGVGSDHTHQSPEGIIEKIANGLFIQFQHKSLTEENMAVVRDHQFHHYSCLITDDIMADELRLGHLNTNLKVAVANGLPMPSAIYMATYTPARHMGLRDRGVISPGKVADFLILKDLDRFEIAATYKNGIQVAADGQLLAASPNAASFSDHLFKSIHCQPLTESDLEIKVTGTKVLANIIAIEAIGTFTKLETIELPVVDGVVQWQGTGLSLLIIQERYDKSGQITHALVKNTLQKPGAISTSWAHDHHNVMTMGNNVASILRANQEVVSQQGGYSVSSAGDLSAFCPLPIGGIISDAPIADLGRDLSRVHDAMVDLGYVNGNVIMSFSTLSLPVSPSVKVTDKGIWDCYTQVPIPLIQEVIE